MKTFGDVDADYVHVQHPFGQVLRLLRLKTCLQIRRRGNIRLIIENPQIRVFTLNEVDSTTWRKRRNLSAWILTKPFRASNIYFHITSGYSIRVDHRTLKAQQVEAEKDGDDFLAKLYKRVPEEHIGVIATHRDGSPATEVKKYREAIQSKQHSLFLVDINQKATEEGETQFFVKQAEGASRVLMNSQAYRSANLNDESLRLLNQELIARLFAMLQTGLFLVKPTS